MSQRSRFRLGCLCVSALTLVFLASPARGETLIAEQLTPESAPDHLFAGTDALGGIGDWYLSNGIVEAIVDDIGFQQDVRDATGAFLPLRTYGYSGGTVIDLGLVGHDNDQFNSFSQAVSLGAADHDLEDTPIIYVPAALSLGNPSLPAILATVDPIEGAASLQVFGRVFPPASGAFGDGIVAVTTYTLRRGESFLRVATSVTNQSAQPVDVAAIGDITLLASGGLLPFVPSPGLGFAIPEAAVVTPFVAFVGRVSPGDGLVDTAAMVEAGEASYTLVSPKQRFLLTYGSPVFFTTRTLRGPTPLPPGESLTYERQIVVGARNDVGASAGEAVGQLAAVFGLPSGSVRGRLIAPDGLPMRAAIEIALLDLDLSTAEPLTLVSVASGDARPEPLSHLSTDSLRDGVFEARLPAGRYELSATIEERGTLGPFRFDVPPGGGVDIGDITVSSLGRLRYRVNDTARERRIPAKVTIEGTHGSPDPVLGVPVNVSMGGRSLLTRTSHSSPARNMAYTVTGEGEVFVRPGDYRVHASRGLEFSHDAVDVTIAEGQTTEVELGIERVVDTDGYVSADFHVHSARSPDSSVPPFDRVFNFAAEGVEVMVASDHNTSFDYQPLIELLDLASEMRSISGVELTTGAWSPLETGFSSLGHWNAWPQEVHPHARKDGAPEEGYVEPNVIFDRLRQRHAEVVQLNHPWWGGQGFLSRIRHDPTRPVDQGPNRFLLREAVTGTGTRNIDFDAIEIYNGSGPFKAYVAARYSWFSFLSQGILRTGTAVSDTHHVSIRHGGFPRTYVASPTTDMRDLDVTAFNNSVKGMRAFGTSGPFLDVSLVTALGAAGFGETARLASGPASLQVRVRAPCWIPVEELRVFANGGLMTAIPLPASCTSVVRYDGSIPVRPGADTYFVVEAGSRLPATADQEPALPTGIMAVIEPGVLPLAFTNPIFLDVDGNGVFDAPGLPTASGP